MRIHNNYLCEVAEMQASRVLAADNGNDEEDEEDEEEEEDEEDEEEDGETVWTGPPGFTRSGGIANIDTGAECAVKDFLSVTSAGGAIWPTRTALRLDIGKKT